MPSIDLNADMGEGVGDDAALVGLVTSANVACGGHAGTAETMRATVRAALDAGVTIGAHPGYEDPESFGRREMHLSDERLHSLLVRQLDRLATIVDAEGGQLAHVKPHGALYNQAAFDSGLADLIAETVAEFDPSLRLVGLAGSELIAAGRRADLAVANEGFADRTYTRAGTLTPRDDPRALVVDPDVAARRAVAMVTESRVATIDGGHIDLRLDTICIHGDSPGAPQLARRLREAFADAGIEIRYP